MKEERNFVEKQYKIVDDVLATKGRSRFGLMANESWNNDPKRTLFTLSRYKFVAKILSGRKNVLEIGCADGFGSRIVKQQVEKLVGIDIDQIFIEDAIVNNNNEAGLSFEVHDILEKKYASEKIFDAAYCLDVLEHIQEEVEEIFVRNVIDSICDEGVLIVGMPSIESQVYASEQSKIGHVNCKSGIKLKELMDKYFHNTFIFSMNDEVVHTGFYKMAHYLIAVCTHKKNNYQK